MPADAVVDAPAAAPAAAPVPATESAPPAPAPVGEISAARMAVDTGPAQPPPKPGSAKDRMFQELRKRAKIDSMDSRSANNEKTAPDQSVPGQAVPSPSGDPKSSGSPASEATAAAAAPEKEKNPWKVVDRWKARATELENEVVKLKSQPADERIKQEYENRLTETQKRADDLEKEIRLTNYEKSQEYQTKYVEPYNKAWRRAGKELSEISVKDNAGNARPATPQDLAALVNLPLGEARALAEEAFGSFANDVMGYRKEILGLLDAQTQAKEDAKNDAVNRDKASQGQVHQIQQFNKEHWTKFNDEFAKDPKVGKYFQPVEGDQEVNGRLQKGFELVDRAYSAPRVDDPNLTPDQRSEIIKMHAAVRNRAASWGRLRYELERSVGRVQELEKELGKYKASTPGTGAPAPITTTGTVRTSARDSVFAALRAKAKPM